MRNPELGARYSAFLVVLLVAGALVGGCGRRQNAPAPTRPTGTSEAPAASAAQPTPGTDSREQELRAAVARAPEDAKARRALGEYLAGSGRPAGGVWELVVARDLAGSSPSDVVALAGALRLSGQLETARDLLAESLTRHPDDLPLMLTLGDALLRGGSVREVLRRLDVAQGARSTPEGLRLLARARYAEGDAAGARAALLAARDGYPGAERVGGGGPFPLPAQQAACDRLLGRMALDEGRQNEARARLGAAAAVAEEDAEIQYDLGRAWAMGQDVESEARARQAFLKALRLDPRHARAAAALTRIVHERRGRWREAAAAYGKALGMDPRLVEAEEGLARVMDRLKMPGEAAYHRARAARLRSRPELAVTLYREWGRLRPERWEAPLRVAQCLQEMRRTPAAIQVLKAAVERFPESAPLHLQLAQLYLITLAPAEAERIVPRWERIDPASGETEWLRGRIAARAGARPDAVRWYEAALKKNARQPAFALSLAETLIEEPSPENLQRARRLLESAESLDPSAGAIPYQLGAVLAAMGETEAALAAYLRSLDRDPDRVEAYGALVPLAQRLGRRRAAAFYARLARTARRQRDERETARRRLWERTAESIDRPSPAARQALARALLRRGDLRGALDHLTAAASSPQGSALVRADLRRVRAVLALAD